MVIEKIKGLRDFIFSTENILSRAYEEGVKLSYVSNYSLGLVPIYEGSDAQGDLIVSTYITSNYAKVAPYGKQLGAEELANVEPEFISPDKSVDASACLYPEYTWFIKDAIHGYISIPKPIMREIIDTETFQRLKNIEQTGMEALYPSATHNRFTHSLGVYHLSKMSFTQFRKNVKTDFKSIENFKNTYCESYPEVAL